MQILRQQFKCKKAIQQKRLIIKSTVMMSILQCIQASIINDDDQFERLKGSTYPTSTFYSSSIFSSTNTLESSSLQLSSRKFIRRTLISATTTFKHNATFSETKKVTVKDISATKTSTISTFSSLDPVSKEKTIPTLFLSKSATVSTVAVSSDVTLQVTGQKIIINTFSTSGLNSSVTLPTEITTASFSSSRLSSTVTLPTNFTTAGFSSYELSSHVTLSTELNTSTTSISSSHLGSTVALSTELNATSISSSHLGSTVALPTEITTASFSSSQFSSNVTLPTKFVTESDTSTLTASDILTKKSTHLFQKTTVDTDDPDLNTSLDSLSTVTFSSSLSLSDATLSSEIKLPTSTNIFQNNTVFTGSSVSDLNRTSSSSTFITEFLQSSKFRTTRQTSILDNLSTQQSFSLSNKPDISVSPSTDSVISPTIVTTARIGQITSDQTVSSTKTTSERHKKRDSSTAFSESTFTITTLQTKIIFSTEDVSASSTAILVCSTCFNITDSNVSLLPEGITASFVASTTLSYDTTTTTTTKLDETISTTPLTTDIDNNFISSTQKIEYTSTVSLFISTRVAGNVVSPYILDTSTTRYVTISTKAKDAKTIQPFSETVLNSSFPNSTSVGPYLKTTDLILSSAELTSKVLTDHDYSTSFTESVSFITELPTQVPYSTNTRFTNTTSISEESTSSIINTSLLNTQNTDAELSSPLQENSTDPFVLSTTSSNEITTPELYETNSISQSATRVDLKSTYVRQTFESTSTKSVLKPAKFTDYFASSLNTDINPTGFTTSPTGAVKSERPSLGPYTVEISNIPHLYTSSIKSDPITSGKDVSSAVPTSKRPTNGDGFTTFTESASIVSVLPSKITFSTFPPSTLISVKSTSSNVNASLRVSYKTETETLSHLPESSVRQTSFSSEKATTELNETISASTETKLTSSTKVFDSTSTDPVFISEVTDQVASFIPDTSPIGFETSSTVAVKSETLSLQPYTETNLNYPTLYSSSIKSGRTPSEKDVSSAVSTSKRSSKYKFSTLLTESLSIKTTLPTKVYFSTKTDSAISTSMPFGLTSSNISTSVPFTYITDSYSLSGRSTTPVGSTTLFDESTATILIKTISTTQSDTRINTKSTSLTKLSEYSSTDSESTEVTGYVTLSMILDTSSTRLVTSPVVAVENHTTTLQPFSESFVSLHTSSTSPAQVTSERTMTTSTKSTFKELTKHEILTTFTELVSITTTSPTRGTVSSEAGFLSTTSISVEGTSSQFKTSLSFTNATDWSISYKEKSTAYFVASTTLYYKTTTTTTTERNKRILTTQPYLRTDTESSISSQKFKASSTYSVFASMKVTDHFASSFIPDTNPSSFVTSSTGGVERGATTVQLFSEAISNSSLLYSSSINPSQIKSDLAISSTEATSRRSWSVEIPTTITESFSSVTALPTKKTFFSKAETATSTSMSVGRTTSNASTYLPFRKITDLNTSSSGPESYTTPFIASTTLSNETTMTKLNETFSTTESVKLIDTKSTSLTVRYESTSTDSVFQSSRPFEHITSSSIPDTSPSDAVERDTTTFQQLSETISSHSLLYLSLSSLGQPTSDKEVSTMPKRTFKPEFSTLRTESVFNITGLPTNAFLSTKTESASSTPIPRGRTNLYSSTSLPSTNCNDSNMSSYLQEKSTTPFVVATTLSNGAITTKVNKTYQSTQSGPPINTKSISLTKIFEYSTTDSKFISRKVTDQVTLSKIPDTSPTRLETSSVVADKKHTTSVHPFSESTLNIFSFYSSSASYGRITSESAVSSAESRSETPTKHEFLTTSTESVAIITGLTTRNLFSSEAWFLSTTPVSVDGTSSNVTKSIPISNYSDSSISYPLPEKSTTNFAESTTLSYKTKTTTIKQEETISTTQLHTRTDTKLNISSRKFESTSANTVFKSTRMTGYFTSFFIPNTNRTSFVTSLTGIVETDATTKQLFSKAISNNSPFLSSTIRPKQITSDQAVSSAESTSRLPRTRFTESLSIITALPTKGTSFTKQESAPITLISVGRTNSNTSTYLPITNITSSNISLSQQERSTIPFIASTTLSYETTIYKLKETYSSTESGSRIDIKSTSLTQGYESTSTDSVFLSSGPFEHIASSFSPDISPVAFATSTYEAVETGTTVQSFSETISNYSPLYLSSGSLDPITYDKEVSSPESTSRRPSKPESTTTFTESVSNLTALPTKVTFTTKKESASSASISVGRTNSYASTSILFTNITDSNKSSPLQERITTPYFQSVTLSYGTTIKLNKSIPSTQSVTQINTKSTSLTKIFEYYSSADSVYISKEVTDIVTSSIIPFTRQTQLETSSVQAVENYTTIQPFSKSISLFYSPSTSRGQKTSERALSSVESTSKEPAKHEFLTTLSDAGLQSTMSISAENTSSYVTISLPFTNVTDSNISYPLAEKSTTTKVESTTLSYVTTTERNGTISTTQSLAHTDTISNNLSQKLEPTSTDVTSSIETVERDTTTRQVFSETSSNSFLLFPSSIMPGQITSDKAVTTAESTFERPRTLEMSTILTESVSMLTSLPTPEPYSTKTGFLLSTPLLVENTSSIITESLPVSNRTTAKLSSNLPETSKVPYAVSTTFSCEITTTKSTELNKTVSTTKSSSRNDNLSTYSTQKFDSISTDSALISTKVTDVVELSVIPYTSPIDFIKSSTKTVENDRTTIQPFSETISNYFPLNLTSIRPGQFTTDKTVSSAESISKTSTKREFSTIYTEPVSIVTLEPYSMKDFFRSSTLISIENTSWDVGTLPVTSMPASHISSFKPKRETTPLVSSTTSSHDKTTKHNERSSAPTISYKTSTTTSNYKDSISTTQINTVSTISHFASKRMESSPTSQTYTNITTISTTTSTPTTLTTTSTKTSSFEDVKSETTSFQSSSSSQIEANSSPRTFRSSTLILSQTTQLAFISKYFVISTVTANLIASVSGKISGNNKTESSPSIQETTTLVEKTQSVRYNNTSNLSTTETSTLGKSEIKSTLSRFLSTVIFYNTTKFVNSSTTINRKTNGKSSTSKETVTSTNSISSTLTAPYTYAPNQIFSTVENSLRTLSSIKPSNDSTESTTSSYDLSSLATKFPEMTVSTFIPKYSNFFMSTSFEPQPTSSVETLTTSDQLPGSFYTCNANENCCENRVHGHIVIIASVIQDHKTTTVTDKVARPVAKATPTTSASTSTTTKTPTVPTQPIPTNRKACHNNRPKGQLIVVASVNQEDCND